MDLFNPAFDLTFLPGSVAVPAAEALMFFTDKSSMTTAAWFEGSITLCLSSPHGSPPPFFRDSV